MSQASQMLKDAMQSAQRRAQLNTCDSFAPSYVLRSDKGRLLLDRLLAEDPISISNGVIENIDLGFSFSCVGPNSTSILNEIRRRYEESGEQIRIPCLDVGAGRGRAAWKMVIAGGVVDLVERVRPLAQSCVETMKVAGRFLRHGEQLDQCYHIYLTNILGNFFSKVHAKYAIVHLGHFLHCLHPRDVRPVFARVHDVLQPGGNVFITCNSLSAYGRTGRKHQSEGNKLTESEYQNLTPFGTFIQQRDVAESEYPGFMAYEAETSELHLPGIDKAFDSVNKERFRMMTGDEKEHVPGFLLAASSACITKRDVSVVDFEGLSLNVMQETKLLTDEELRHTKGDVHTTRITRVIHVWDHETLIRHATSAGFEIVSCFYTDDRNEYISHTLPSAQQFAAGHVALHAQLRKPGAIPPAIVPQLPVSTKDPASVTATATPAQPTVIAISSSSFKDPIPLDEFLSLERKETARYQQMTQLIPRKPNPSHVCTVSCPSNRPMNLVIESVKRAIPTEKVYARLLCDALTALQKRVADLDDPNTSEHNAMWSTVGRILNWYVCDDDSFQNVCRGIVNGDLDYLAYLAKPRSDSTCSTFRSEMLTTLTMDRLALELTTHCVPHEFVLARLLATRSERCIYFSGTYTYF